MVRKIKCLELTTERLHPIVQIEQTSILVFFMNAIENYYTDTEYHFCLLCEHVCYAEQINMIITKNQMTQKDYNHLVECLSYQEIGFLIVHNNDGTKQGYRLRTLPNKPTFVINFIDSSTFEATFYFNRPAFNASILNVEELKEIRGIKSQNI